VVLCNFSIISSVLGIVSYHLIKYHEKKSDTKILTVTCTRHFPQQTMTWINRAKNEDIKCSDQELFAAFLSISRVTFLNTIDLCY
jgi:hypothetical protein